MTATDPTQTESMAIEEPSEPPEQPSEDTHKPKSGRFKWALGTFILIFLFTFTCAFGDTISGEIYKTNLRLAAGAVTFWWVLVALYKRLRNKWLLGVTLILSLVALGITGEEPFRRAYHESIPTVGTEVDIGQYRPFKRGAKLARLKEPASLKISTNPPVLDGATALYPVYAAFAQAVYPRGDYNPETSVVRMRRTIDAYEALSQGRADLIFVAGPDDAQERAAGSRLRMTPIGREAFVFFVHKKNPIDRLTSAQIRDIYAGRITNWSELGGDDAPIRAYQRPSGSGSQSALLRFMGDTPPQEAPTEDVPQFMGEIVSEVADYRNYKNAIGFSFRYYTTEMLKNGEIKLLTIDNHAPTHEHIRTRAYPITETFYAVTAGSKNPHTKPLIQWILSPQGQQLIEETGYVAISKAN